jgi:hypothetical protein
VEVHLRRSMVLVLGLFAATIAMRPRLVHGEERGRSFYVDPEGNDANAGFQPSSAWRTLAKVNSAEFLPGDTIYLKRGGLWRESLVPRRGGTPGRPIVYTAFGPGAEPRVSGSDAIAGWVQFKGPVYRAPCSARPGNVYIDGGPGWGLKQSAALEGIERGSWFWQSGSSQLYLRLDDDSDPSGQVVEAAVRLYGLKVIANGDEKSNLIIDGLAFERTAGYGIYFYSNTRGGRGLTGVVIRNNRVRQTGSGTVDAGEYYNAIHFSEHEQLNTAPQFINNTISYSGGHGNAINSQNADGAQLLGNRADHFNHHGFDTKGSASVLISGNIAHDAPDQNGIYQEYCRNGLIERNIVYNLGGSVPGRGSGIQVDVGSSGTRVAHNSIFNVLTGIYLNVPAVVESNAVSAARHAVLEANAGGTFHNNVWGRAPIFFFAGRKLTFAQWSAMPDTGGDLAVDPGWVDPTRGDFELAPSSACIAMDAGALPLHR